MKKIRVLEVLDTYYPNFDGPVCVVTNYAKNLIKKENVDASVCVPRFPKYVDNQPFEVVRTSSIPVLDGNRMPTPWADRKLKKYLKENHFDIIHFHSPFTMCKYFTKYAKKHNIPTIYTFHTKFKEDYIRVVKIKPFVSFLMHYMMKNINKVDYVWTVSDGAAQTLREYGYKGDIKVVRNGTDLVYPNNAQQLIDAINQKYNLSKDMTMFLSVGRIVENKKLQLAFNALKIVADKGYNFRYFVVGDGSYAKQLKKLCEDLGLNDKVVFTGKIMDRELLSAHYLRANLFLFPSTFDTASLSPIEAAAQKLPTLMTKGCPTAEIVIDNQNGFTAEEDATAWANKIIEILNNKKALDDMKETTYKEVYKSWGDVVDVVLDEYYKILGEKK